MSRWNEYLDLIRVSAKPEDELVHDAPRCEHVGCSASGLYRAPKGRQFEGEYHTFCEQHVREYNKRYNYFDGMSDDELFSYQKSASIGHRPTWSMGDRAASDRASLHAKRSAEIDARLKSIFQDGVTFEDNRRAETHRPPVRNAERQAFSVLNLDVDVSAEDIRDRYKTLAKRLHPDLNKGDRSTEEQLKMVIDAYNYLKGQGFC